MPQLSSSISFLSVISLAVLTTCRPIKQENLHRFHNRNVFDESLLLPEESSFEQQQTLPESYLLSSGGFDDLAFLDEDVLQISPPPPQFTASDPSTSWIADGGSFSPCLSGTSALGSCCTADPPPPGSGNGYTCDPSLSPESSPPNDKLGTNTDDGGLSDFLRSFFTNNNNNIAPETNVPNSNPPSVPPPNNSPAFPPSP